MIRGGGRDVEGENTDVGGERYYIKDYRIADRGKSERENRELEVEIGDRVSEDDRGGDSRGRRRD